MNCLTNKTYTNKQRANNCASVLSTREQIFPNSKISSTFPLSNYWKYIISLSFTFGALRLLLKSLLAFAFVLSSHAVKVVLNKRRRRRRKICRQLSPETLSEEKLHINIIFGFGAVGPSLYRRV